MKWIQKSAFFSLFVTSLSPTNGFADEAEVVEVVARMTASGDASFEVTVSHADSGWKHYADRWDVLDADGNLLGQRVLLHPHVNEQPFTRSLRGVAIPVEITEVYIQAHDSVHGNGPKYGPVMLRR
jgi:hypothetical protein